MDPLSWLISYTSEPAVTAAILITSDPVISRHAQMDRTPRRRGGTVACGWRVAPWRRGMTTVKGVRSGSIVVKVTQTTLDLTCFTALSTSMNWMEH